MSRVRCIAEPTVSVRHPVLGTMMVLSRNDADRDADDPIVQRYPWAFEEIETAKPVSRRGRGRKTETATAAPDESRD